MSIGIQCIICLRYLGVKNQFGPCCEAFPNGIPEVIFLGKFDHNFPHPKDNGLLFISNGEFKFMLRKLCFEEYCSAYDFPHGDRALCKSRVRGK